MRAALRVTLTAILEEELTAIIGAGRYEQTKERRDKRNGSYGRDLLTSVGEIEVLTVPRSRKGHRTQLFERYQRRQSELDAAMLKMFVGGNSTEQVGQVVEALTGSTPSPSTVSRLFHTLEIARHTHDLDLPCLQTDCRVVGGLLAPPGSGRVG